MASFHWWFLERCTGVRCDADALSVEDCGKTGSAIREGFEDSLSVVIAPEEGAGFAMFDGAAIGGDHLLGAGAEGCGGRDNGGIEMTRRVVEFILHFLWRHRVGPLCEHPYEVEDVPH